MSKPKHHFSCQQCGANFPAWQGQCTTCLDWNTLVEEIVVSTTHANAASSLDTSTKSALRLGDVALKENVIIPSGISELDRVLGQGLVKGSIFLLGGEPGVGKSTLALKMALNLVEAGQRVLYVSGEESLDQLLLRARRLSGRYHELLVLTAQNILEIIHSVKKLDVDVLIIDSIQVVFHPDYSAISGSVTQVRQCAQEIISLSKSLSIATILVGHITKDGQLAGPKVLEHLVDGVLIMEGQRDQSLRILRAFKNRFATTQEIGLFEMNETGIQVLRDASTFFIDEGVFSRIGSILVPACEGIRVIMVEIQALVVDTSYGMAKRTFLGVDNNRANLMIAATEKILGLKLGAKDIFINIVGGLKMSEPALDLGIVMAMLSSLKGGTLGGKVAVFGEIGLTGEIRKVTNADKRIFEVEQLGFDRVVCPFNAKKNKKQTIHMSEIKHLAELDGYF